MNFQVESDSRSHDVTIPIAIKMMPAMIIAAARKKVTDRRLLPSCELLPLKNDPVGVCAETEATPTSSINAAAIGPFSVLTVKATVINLRPMRTARD